MKLSSSGSKNFLMREAPLLLCSMRKKSLLLRYIIYLLGLELSELSLSLCDLTSA